jgi:hypothetical protein
MGEESVPGWPSKVSSYSKQLPLRWIGPEPSIVCSPSSSRILASTGLSALLGDLAATSSTPK